MATTKSKSFSAVGWASGSSLLLLKPTDSFSYAVSGTFVGTWIVQKSTNGGQSWETVASGTGTVSATSVQLVESENVYGVMVRTGCTAYTSGTIATTITDYEDAPSGRVFEYAGTALTITEAHRDKVIYCTSSSAVTITVGVVQPGFEFAVVQGGTGAVTLAASGSSLQSKDSAAATSAQGAGFSVVGVPGYWWLGGSLA